MRILLIKSFKSLSTFLLYLIFIDVPFPRTIRNAPMTLCSLTWDRPDEDCPSAFHCLVHRTTPPLWRSHFGMTPWQSNWTEVHIHAYLDIRLGHTRALCSHKHRVWQVNSVFGCTLWYPRHVLGYCGRDAHPGSAHHGQTLPIDASHKEGHWC